MSHINCGFLFHIFEEFCGCENIVKYEFKNPGFVQSRLYELHDPKR